MPKWTSEQLEAIEKSGSNIIVSAGAGSGKTAVLSERVLYKLKNGIHINELLILTFTRAAAEEMKDRIRKKIKADESLKHEVDLIDSSYITTFDSFALSVVKKNHYLLNIPRDIGISDAAVLVIEKNKILESVFNDFYKNGEEKFSKLIDKYCVKNDDYIKSVIKELINKIDNFLDRDGYLDSIMEKFSDEFVNSIIDEYKSFIDNKKKEVSLELNNTSYYFDEKFMSSLNSLVLPIINTTSLDELIMYNSVRLPNAPRGSEDDAKEAKARLKDAITELLGYAKFGNEETIKKDILSCKDYVEATLNIIREYYKKLDEYKHLNNVYTFQDIAGLAIKVLRENESARLELKSSFKEIMIDEYQDTNDIQETFISMIANNNVYMVGDIKQSIYRFRNSNPIIFKDKYDNYSNGNGGLKIDLIKNFRSRSEVLDNINKMFDLLMDNNLGGAEYSLSHEMKYGNTSYDEEVMPNYNYNMKVLEYENEDTGYTDSEIEIFTILKDIKDKINSHHKVFDKNTSTMRDAKYSDFVIILDRSKYFDDYKRVFEYMDIPFTILRDGKLNNSDDILLIKNIIDLIIRIRNNDFGDEFKYVFTSVGRSFLYEYSDQYLFDIITENRYKETTLYEDFKSFENFNSMTSDEILSNILSITDFYDKLYKVGDYENINVRLSAINDIAKNLSEIGMSIIEFKEYLDEVIKDQIETKYVEYNSGADSVKVLTIHKSKGLEYPFCYFADLNHEFNTSDVKSKFICDKRYGIIAPTNSEDNTDSVLKMLFRNNFIKDEIDEKIRLFYVALTRAREQIIIVLPKKDVLKLEKGDNGALEYVRRIKFRSLASFVYGFKPYMEEYFENVNIEKLGLTKNYLYNKSMKDKFYSNNATTFKVDEIDIPYIKLEESHFSKSSLEFISKDSKDNMEFGTLVHEALEYADFKNFNSDLIDNKFIKDKIVKFLNNDILKNIKDANIYHEYDFYYNMNDVNYHGIIDLMLEYEDHIDIIDYKLKNVLDEHYISQLSGYKNYIESISNKKVNTYLYSIIDEKFTEI